MATIEQIEAPYLQFAEGAAPSTPGSGLVRLYAKTDGSLYQKDDAGTETGLAGGGSGGSITDLIVIQDQKTQNTDGGTFTSGAWRTRDLNTEVVDTGGHASVASNQITLAAGTYRALIVCPGQAVDRHQARLYNVSDSAVVLTGTSSWAPQSADAGYPSVIEGRFTLAATKTLEVQHQCQTTKTTFGFGVASNFGTEVYTTVRFEREP